MTEGGISKKVFVASNLVSAITGIAASDETPENKLMYVYVMAGILVIFLLIQACLDYINDRRTRPDR